VDILWYLGGQNIGLFNRKLKSALKYTVLLQCTPAETKQIDRGTNIMAIARLFVLTSARAKTTDQKLT